MAKSLDIPFGTYRGWNSYKRLPDAASAHWIAQFLGTTVEYLVSGNEPDTSRKYRDRLEAIKDLVNKPI